MTTPGHPVTVTGLITDPTGKLLILRPAGGHSPWWYLPGGPLTYRQSPPEALHALIRHQLTVALAIGPLHLTGYQQALYDTTVDPPREVAPAEVVLLFDCGVHDQEALSEAGLWPGKSVAMYRWATPGEAAQTLEPEEWRRTHWALRHPRSGVYLHPHTEPDKTGGAEADGAHDAPGRHRASGGSQEG
jgi:hypothetical protein